MNKYYIYGDESEHFEEDIKKYLKLKEKDPSLKLVLVAEKQELLDENFSSKSFQLIQQLAHLGVRPHDMVFSMPAKDANFSHAEWEQAKNSVKILQKQGVDFAFDDVEQLWSIEEVENANGQIKDVANKIREKKLSPVEKLMAAYLEVTKRNYKYESASEHFSQSRSVYGVLNSDKIVCVGYAALLKAIMEELGDKNVEVHFNSVACANDNEEIIGYHRNVIIYIKDEKYGIDGYYYLDQTWDSSKGDKQEYNFNYFLVPLKDIQHIRTDIRDYNVKLPREKKAAKKPKYKTVKERKAIAKNKHKTFNRAGVANSSFSSDKFSANKEMLESVADNENIFNTVTQYFHLGEELYLQNEEGNKLVENKLEELNIVNMYLKESKVTMLSKEESKKILEIGKSGNVEDCLKYADQIIESRGIGDKSLENLKASVLDIVRQKLEKEKDIEWDKDLIDTLSKGKSNEEESEFLKKLKTDLEKKLLEIDTTIELLDKYFNEHPENLYDIYNMNQINQNAMESLIFHLYLNEDINESTISEIVTNSIKREKILGDFTYVDKIFEEVNEQIKRSSQGASKVEIAEIKQKMFYEAMCDTSKPLDVSVFSRALFNVMKSYYPEVEPQKIKSFVDKVIEKNMKQSRRCFKEGASNSFYACNEARIELKHQDRHN
ncbi:MAG: hypothetical protein E7376_05565 [Clostridiales bacterium]|nr:hypothetical protein [Clostridiales bacterium]